VAANTWSAGPPMPVAANAPGGTVFENKFWVVGGGDQPGPGAPQSINNTQIYDPATNSWSAGAPVRLARSFAEAESVYTINGEMAMYVAGYDAAAGTPVNNVEGYLTMCSSPSPTPTPFSPSPSAHGTPTPTHTATWTPTGTPTPTVTPTATFTPTASPTCGPGYTTSWITGTLTAATDNTGNSCDDCVTSITLPFQVSLYGNSFTSAQVDSNGVLAFTSATSTFLNTCLPYPNYTDAIFAYWDDLITDNSDPICASYPGGTCGIFTAVTGSAPSRTFVIEWRAAYFNSIGMANFEILLHENSSDFEVVYGELADGGASATTGVQQGQGEEGHYTQFSCNATFLNNSQVNYTLVACVSPTPTATGTSGPTPTSTGMSPTATSTGTPGNVTATPTPTSTGQNTPVGTATPSGTCTPLSGVLWDQTDNGAATSTTSQNFEAKLDGFDSEVADDFMVPSGRSWSVTHVNVSGNYFAGVGPADSVNVVFYNIGTLPGNAVCTFNNVAIASGAETGSFGIDLPSQCSLFSGTFWVSVQANMNFTPNGQWGWKDRTIQTINGAAFRNPGGAFMCSTNDWVLKTACVGGNAPDQIFQIVGTTGMCGTPTNTPTNTPTPTVTATNTPTADPSPTPSSPGSPTATSTATFTPTNTATPIHTPTATATAPTPTASATLQKTATTTPTATNTATPTDTPTASPTATPPLRSRADFDGDGRTDLSVYRPSEGNWYYEGSTSGFNAVHFGESTDIPAPGDFDGDRKTDISVFRPSTGYWYRLDSSTGTFSFVNWGLDGDIPQAGDYDGDGLADQAVFRPSNGSWYWIRSSDNQQNGMQFGQNGDKPVTADYDGDGTTDISVFRGGLWYRVNSSDGSFYGEAFGLDNDIPTPADYDGDDRDDIAVFRPSDGNWYFHFSGNGQYGGIHWGQNGDMPVPGDYDADNHYDTAVYRDGIWYIDASTEGSSAMPFGLSTDIPIPKMYIP